MTRFRRHAPGLLFVALVAFVVIGAVLAGLLALVTFAAIERVQAACLLCASPALKPRRRA